MNKISSRLFDIVIVLYFPFYSLPPRNKRERKGDRVGERERERERERKDSTKGDRLSSSRQGMC